MKLTPWKLPSGTYTMEVSSWNLHPRRQIMELTPWKLPHGTYTIKVTSWNLHHGRYLL